MVNVPNHTNKKFKSITIRKLLFSLICFSFIVTANAVNPTATDTVASTNQTKTNNSYWGFGVGFAYEFPVVDGKTNTDNGIYGVRVPLFYNHVFGSSKSGIFASVAYEYNGKETKVNGEKYKYKYHRVPMMLHYSWNPRFANTKRGNEQGLIFHCGPGLNILAGGSIQQYHYAKKSEDRGWDKVSSMDSQCDFTLGFGLGYRLEPFMIHFGFNGAVTHPKGYDKMHNCDLDLSFLFAF